jgi:hypothetical protein
MATDHAREQGEQQEPAETWKHALKNSMAMTLPTGAVRST